MKKRNSRRISLTLAVVMLLASVVVMSSAVGTTLAEPVYTIEHAATGISAVMSPGVLPEGTTMNVTFDAHEEPAAAGALRIGAWDISFTYNGAPAQFNDGRVTIRMPIDAAHAAAARARVYSVAATPAAALHANSVQQPDGTAPVLSFEITAAGVFTVSTTPRDDTTTTAATTGTGETTTTTATTTAVPTFTLTHAGTNIQAIVPQGVLPAGSVIMVESAPVTVAPADGGPAVMSHRISFRHNETAVSPTGTLTIRMPIPANTQNPATLLVRRSDPATGATTAQQPTNIRVDAGFLVFDTTADGIFFVVRNMDTTTTAATTTTTVDPSASTTTTAPDPSASSTATTADKDGGLTSGPPPMPPQTGFSLSTSAAVAAVILALGGVYFGWRYFKQKDED